MAKRTRNRRPKRSRPKRSLRADRPEALRPDAEGGTLGAEARSGTLRSGTVVTLYSGACRIESGGRLYEAVLPSRLARVQRSAVAVGDEVRFAAHGRSHRIVEIRPRRTVLSRPDPSNPRLERVIAANVDVVVQVVSVAKPPIRPALIDRYLIAIGRGGAEALLCANKIDLLAADELSAELAKLDVYRDMGPTVFSCSALTGAGVDELGSALAGRTAVFAGESGVGKSSLLKALAPGLEVTTGEVSRRYARGRHTTTRSELYRLTRDIRVIDTPGIREMGLWQITPEELRFYFPDFDDDARGCRFNDCTHTHEPDCAVRAALRQGRLSEARYAAYVRILQSLEA